MHMQFFFCPCQFILCKNSKNLGERTSQRVFGGCAALQRKDSGVTGGTLTYSGIKGSLI